MTGAVNIHLQASGASPSAAEVAKVAGSLNALHGAQTKASGSSRNLGNAVLQGSRALQDMQYGLAGAVNNLEGIAAALGLGSGVAGVVTVLAVAIQQLGPKVIDMLKSFDGTAAVKAEVEALQAQLGDATPVDAAAKAGERYATQLRAESEALNAANAAIAQQLKLLSLQSAAKKSQAAFELEQGIQDIQAQKLGPEMERLKIAELKIRFAQEEKAIADKQASDEQAAADALARKAAQDAAAKGEALARLDAMIERTARVSDLEAERLRLAEEYAAAQKAAYDVELGQMDSPQQQRLREQMAANTAETQALVAQGVGDLPALQTQRQIVGGAAITLATSAAEKVRKADELRQQQALQAQERQRELEREQQRAAREARPGGVFGPNLVQPGSPFGFTPAPLPGPGGPPISSLPPSPLEAGLPQLSQGTQAMQEAANANQQGAQAILSFASTATTEMQRMREQQLALEQKLKTLEAQTKNMR